MTIDDLDSLFSYLYKKGPEYMKYRDIVSEHFKNDETTFDIEGMLIKLDKDGYVDTGQHHTSQKLGWTDQTTYKLSFEGRFLYENSYQNRPYKGLNRKERRKKIWTIASTIAAIINAIIIIVIAYFGVKAQIEANKINKPGTQNATK